MRQILTLHNPLYLLKLEEGELVIQPILFKTVRGGKEYVLWQHRKTVLKLKIFDVIAYQKSTWKRPISKFNLECPNIVPGFPLNPNICSLFNLSGMDNRAEHYGFSASHDEYENYIRSIDDMEAMFQEEETPCQKKEEPPREEIPKPQAAPHGGTIQQTVVMTASDDTRTITNTFTAMDSETSSQSTSSKHSHSYLGHFGLEAITLKKRQAKNSHEVEDVSWKYIEQRTNQKDSTVLRDQQTEGLKTVIKSIILTDKSTIDPLRTVANKLMTERDEVPSISSFERTSNQTKSKSYKLGLLIEGVVNDMDSKRIKLS